MTDNDFADPWGLPPSADDDDVTADPPAESTRPAEPMSEPAPDSPEPPPETSSADEPEPASAEPTSAEQATSSESPSDDAADDDEEPNEQEDADEPPNEEEADDESPTEEQAPPAASGPYSQVLAAASGLFGRSATPVPREPVEIEGAVEHAESAAEEGIDVEIAPDGPGPDDSIDASESIDTAGEATDDVTDAIGEGADSSDEVEDVLASLGADATDEVEVDAPVDTVSVEEIAAMASQLEVETPEPFEVSFTTEADAVDPETAEALSGMEVDEPDISIDMDSAPSVFEELSDSMGEAAADESEEPLPGGFDVGAVFHSEQAAAAEDHVDDLTVEVDEDAGADTAEDISLVDEAAEEESSVDETSEPAQQEDPFAVATSVEMVGEPDPFGESSHAESHDDGGSAAHDAGDEAIVSSEDPMDEGIDEDHASAGAGQVGTAAAVAAGAASAATSTSQEDTGPSRFVDSGEVEWGARWHESAQGWVEDTSGQATWRPIVTTASTLSEWVVDTYLGIVVGDSPVSTGAPMDTAMALSRQHAMRVMVDEALSRGAHAVIGVQLGVADVGSIPLATAIGTAVTLKPGDA